MNPGVTGKELRELRDKMDKASIQELRSMVYMYELRNRRLQCRNYELRKALTDINSIVDPTPDDLRGPASRVVDVLYLSVDALREDNRWERTLND